VRSVAAAVLGLAVAVGASRQQADVRVPVAVMAAAERGPLSLAHALATLGVPAGLVTRENPSVVEAVTVDPDSRETTPLTTVLSAFSSRHPGYAVKWRPPVFGIEETGLACADAARALTIKPARMTSDMPRLLVMLAWLASGDPPPVPGGQISTLGGKTVAAAAPPLPSLDLILSRTTSLESAFDKVVTLNKGGVWIIWEHRRDDGNIGCRSVGYYSNGHVGASSQDFAVLSGAGVPHPGQRESRVDRSGVQ